MDDFNDISRIIAANQLGTPLSEAEKERLEAWLQASESNRQLYDRIGRLHATRQILRLEEENKECGGTDRLTLHHRCR